MKYIVTFLILFVNWLIWSGMFDSFHVSLGVISCGIVTFMSHDLFFGSGKFHFGHVTEFIRFVLYIPWLLYQIILSNIHVAYLVLHPKMLIEPSMITFETILKKDISIVTFANSITLTPGTITIDIKDGKYFVIHCISRKVADDLLSGEMERKIARIFGEN